MRSVVNRLGRAALVGVLVSSIAVAGVAQPASAEPRTELYITYYAEPELLTPVGASWYCNGQPFQWGETTPYRTFEHNDFC